MARDLVSTQTFISWLVMPHTPWTSSYCLVLIIIFRGTPFNSFSQPNETVFVLCLMTWLPHGAINTTGDDMSFHHRENIAQYYPASIWGIYLPVQSVTGALWHKPLMQCSQWCKCHLYMLMISFFIDTSCDKISTMALIIITATWKSIAIHVRQFLFSQTITV